MIFIFCLTLPKSFLWILWHDSSNCRQLNRLLVSLSTKTQKFHILQTCPNPSCLRSYGSLMHSSRNAHLWMGKESERDSKEATTRKASAEQEGTTREWMLAHLEQSWQAHFQVHLLWNNDKLLMNHPVLLWVLQGCSASTRRNWRIILQAEWASTRHMNALSVSLLSCRWRTGKRRKW